MRILGFALLVLAVTIVSAADRVVLFEEYTSVG